MELCTNGRPCGGETLQYPPITQASQLVILGVDFCVPFAGKCLGVVAIREGVAEGGQGRQGRGGSVFKWRSQGRQGGDGWVVEVARLSEGCPRASLAPVRRWYLGDYWKGWWQRQRRLQVVRGDAP